MEGKQGEKVGKKRDAQRNAEWAHRGEDYRGVRKRAGKDGGCSVWGQLVQPLAGCGLYTPRQSSRIRVMEPHRNALSPVLSLRPKGQSSSHCNTAMNGSESVSATFGGTRW